MTIGPEPITAPGIHDLPANAGTKSSNAQLQAQLKSRTTAIRYHLMADVLYAVAGSVSGIPVLGPAVGHALSAWADTLEAQAIDAMNSANNAQSSANYANLQLSLLMSGTLASSVPGGVSVDYQFDGGSANDLGSDWSRNSSGPGGGHYGPNGSGKTTTLYAALAELDADHRDVDQLVATGRDVLADVVGPDGQLTVTTVHQHRQLDGPGPADVPQRIEGRAHRTAVEEHVVDQDHQRVVDAGGRN